PRAAAGARRDPDRRDSRHGDARHRVEGGGYGAPRVLHAAHHGCDANDQPVISFFPPHQHEEVRHLLSTALQAIVSLRLVPRKDGKGRVPASEVLINTAAVQENMRDLTKSLSIP